MKVIRDEDKKSNKYIIRFEVEKCTRNKPYFEKNLGGITITTEEYSELVLHMADGSKPRYDNLEENKVRLLKLRYKQFLNNKTKLKELKVYKTLFNAIFSGFAGVVIAVSTLSPSSPAIILQWSLISIPLAATAAFISNKIINNKINDIKKYALFFENEDIFKDVDLDDSNILERVKSKDKNVITKIKQEKDSENEKTYFDNNSIDGLSLDALKRIKENIERENYLSLVRTDEETKGKSYVKK